MVHFVPCGGAFIELGQDRTNFNVSGNRCRWDQPCSNLVDQPAMSNADQVQGDFFGVYLLQTQNPIFKGRVYVGFTVDPQRRLKQHNGGRDKGGACRTSQKGPWDMILVVHGFPNMISALRFEWAWQHPKRSRRLRHIPAKKAREKTLDFHLRLVGEMLKTGPWDRLALTIQWIKPSLQVDLEAPNHMPIRSGLITVAKKKSKAEEADEPLESLICSICIEPTRSGSSSDQDDQVQCLSDRCGATFHLFCMARHFRGQPENQGKFLPLRGTCPICEISHFWADLVRVLKNSRRKTAKDGVEIADDPEVVGGVEDLL
eukprot:maker-scaffold585_size130225-snap-gene-0.21 protein:Tk05226 transcript:maker-scaffold585_size130225-snap-gene-0.21-mRNA-1 annotation:"structure-specific endonuclease slx1"